MTNSALARHEITAVIGPVEDELAARIAGTGATAAELTEAHLWLAADEALLNEGRPMPAGRVGELVEILEEANAAEEEPGPAPTPSPE